MNKEDRRFLELVGSRIRERRVAAGRARRTAPHIHRVGRTGERNVALLSLRRIAASLRVPPAELLTSSEGE